MIQYELVIEVKNIMRYLYILNYTCEEIVERDVFVHTAYILYGEILAEAWTKENENLKLDKF